MRLFPLLVLMSIPLHAAPLIVAHRGASGDAPENTIPAFQLAWKQNADAIEGDFHLTKDGHIVCIHDKNTEKVAGQKLVVADSTLEQLRVLDVGSWKDPQWEGTRIPTLAEVVETVPKGKRIYVEVKAGPEIVPLLLKQLRSSALTPGQIVIIAFDQNVIKAVKSEAPEYEANWLCAFRKKHDQDEPTRESVLETLEQCGADGLSTNAYPAIDAEFVAMVRAGGSAYHVWTINDAPTALRFRDLGADSITTDFPAVIREDINREDINREDINREDVDREDVDREDVNLEDISSEDVDQR